MNGPRVVGLRHIQEAVAAVEQGAVIAVPGDGGYSLAVSLSRPDALAKMGGQDPTGNGSAVHVMVGRRLQAIALSSAWSKETGLLTDRMWPGPLMIVVPGRQVGPASPEPVVHITMPKSRALRDLIVAAGPLAVRALLRPDGVPLADPKEVGVRFTESDLALIVDGGACPGPGLTVVDCTVSPPRVLRVGALPESYVDAALMMGSRRRPRFFKRGS
jgi:L-threonylcarbamoyladenylate synthase